MNTKYIFISLIALLLSLGSYAQKNDPEKANKAIAEFKKTDAGIAEFFNTAYGYAVFPGIGKGGLGVGGAAGKGTVYKEGTPVADCKMTQITVGFQAGGQKYAEVIFFENADAYERFVGNNFEFGAQVSAVALKSGVSADAKYRDGILVFTQAIGGLMYEASIGGQKFKTDMY